MIGEPTNIFDHDDDDEAGTAVEFSWSALHLRNGRRQVDELGHKIRDMEEEKKKEKLFSITKVVKLPLCF